jgi:succinylglutamate desuccinylase
VWRTMKRMFENVHEADSDDETLFAMKERHQSDKAVSELSDDETLHVKKERWRYDYHTC